MDKGAIDQMRDRQEPASYTLQPRRDLVAEAIERTKAKIAACFTDIPRSRARLKRSPGKEG